MTPMRNGGPTASPLLAMAVVGLSLACGPDARDAAEGFVELPTAWTLSAEPVVRIGDEGGGPATFERLGGVLVDGEGRVVVVDAGAAQIHFFSAAGRHLSTAAGAGEGPGEFGVPGLLGRMAGDSLVLVDRRDQDVTILAPDGSFGRSHPLLGPEQGRPLQALGVVRDGRLVVHFVEFFGQLEEGVVFGDTLALSLIDPVTAELSGLGPAGSLTFYWTGETQVLLPFAATAALDARGDRVVSLDPSGRQILVYRMPPEDGFRLEPPHTHTPVTAEDREAYRRYVERAPGDEARRRAALEALEHPDVPATKPVYDGVKVTEAGGVWARRWSLAEEARQWDVYAADGALRGTVTTPAGFQVEDVSGDLVVGVRTDSLGVASIEGYGLLSGGG